MKKVLFILSIFVLFSCSKEESLEGAELLQQRPQTEEAEADPCEFEWNREAKDFIVEHAYLNINHCTGQKHFIVEVQLSETTWEQFGFDLNRMEQVTGCIDYHWNEAPNLVWRKIIEKA